VCYLSSPTLPSPFLLGCGKGSFDRWFNCNDIPRIVKFRLDKMFLFLYYKKHHLGALSELK